MRAILVRIFVDNAYGCWNAPVDTGTGEFVYCPIPEAPGRDFHPGCERRYTEVRPVVARFYESRGIAPKGRLAMPEELDERAMHLDPDFEHLTYGDVGNRRGSGIRTLKRDDLLVFYAGLRSTRREERTLVYAIVGLYVVDEIVPATSVPAARAHENAHTRKVVRGEEDIVVRARPGVSGRCARCVPIGELRPPSNYYVRDELLEAWGGFRTNGGKPRNGYLTRSAVPPEFVSPEKFLGWWQDQKVELIRSNFA